MIYAVDTYFEYVAARMASVVNPNRRVVGVMDAMDWPPKTVLMESFYLLLLGERPMIGKEFWSAAIPVEVHTLQWTWIIQGGELTQGKVGRSRGDRYRTNMLMRQEILQGTYPWFCQKQSWGVQGTTPSGVSLVGTPVVPNECIWWNQPTFLNRVDRESGMIFGTATVQVVDMTQEIDT